MMNMGIKGVLVSVVALVILSGCIGQVPTPGFARKGDVVNLNLGGIKRNANMQEINITDLTVTITDSDSQVYSPQLLGTYRAFPDHTSQYAVSAQNRADPNFGQLYPHDGALWLTIRLFDPQSGPLPLAVGPATISISSPKLVQTSFTYDGDYTNIPIEILPGTGTPSLADNQNQAYQTNTYLTVAPSTTTGVGTVGGMQVEIVYNDSVTSGDPYELRAVPLNHDPNISLIQSITDNGDGTKTLVAMLTNPNGFVDLPSWTQGQSTYFDLRLGLVSSKGLTAFQNWMTDFTLVTTNSFYVDINGNPIGAASPVLLKEFN